MKAMISQPRYLPSVSYLERIDKSDVFIILDNVQRVERGFENRNKVKNKQGVEKWLTIPIQSSSRSIIKDTIINGLDWKATHLNTIKAYYSNENRLHTLYEEYLESFQSESYIDGLYNSLLFLKKLYGIQTEFVKASTISNTINGGIEELINLTKAVKCDTYISGETCLSYGLNHEYARERNLYLEIDKSTKNYTWVNDIVHRLI